MRATFHPLVNNFQYSNTAICRVSVTKCDIKSVTSVASNAVTIKEKRPEQKIPRIFRLPDTHLQYDRGE